MPKIILASASPRRKQLLEGLGLQFEVVDAGMEEQCAAKDPVELVQTLALRKAQLVAAQKKGGLIIGADTVVVWHGAILGKPQDRIEAKQMLTQLSGSMHTVYTGVAIVETKTYQKVLDYATTNVFFHPLSEQEIDWYIGTGEPLDKAGSYGIQGYGGLWVQRVDGCYYNVVGLPISRLLPLFRSFQIELVDLLRPVPR